jgi:hypothetical protein
MMDMLNANIDKPRHQVVPLCMALDCMTAAILVIAIYQLIAYLTGSSLASAILIFLALATHATVDPYNVLGDSLYFLGHGIAFVYCKLKSGFDDGRDRRSSTQSLPRKTAFQDAMLRATNELTIHLPGAAGQ